MENKNQLMSQGSSEVRPEMPPAVSPSPQPPPCAPDHAIAGSSDQPVGSSERPMPESPVPTVCLPGHSSPQPVDSKNCRECLGALAHRLAQPMTALRGGLELALRGKHSAPDYRSLVEEWLQLADSMTKLVVSMRDLGESNATGGAPQRIPLESAARGVLAELGVLAEARDLRLQLQAEETVEICADPERLHEGLQGLLAWVIQNSAGGDRLDLTISASNGEAHLVVSPPRLDLQYLQIKVLEDFTTPGVLFSHATKAGAIAWIINKRLVEGLGGKLEILTDNSEASGIRVRFPLAPAG